MAAFESGLSEKDKLAQITEISLTEKSGGFQRRDSPASDTSKSAKSEKDDNATVALYDVKHNQFKKMKRREAERR